MHPPSVPATAANLDAWDVIDQSIDELTRVAREPLTPSAFYGELLRRVVETLAARRVTVWERTDVWTPVRTAAGADLAFDGNAMPGACDGATVESRARVVAAASTRSEPCALAPGDSLGDDDSFTNPTRSLLLLAAWKVDGESQGVLEVEQRASASPEARQGALRLLATFVQIAADYQRNRDRIRWKDRAAASEELDDILTAVHADSDSRSVAYSLANEGRRWVGADRVSVLTFDGRRAHAAAVSGVDIVDRRADAVRMLERLAADAVRHRTEIESCARRDSVAPEVERALAEYIEHSESRELTLLLLFAPRKEAPKEPERQPKVSQNDQAPVIGALVFEQFVGRSFDSVARERMLLLRRHGATAMAHAAELESIPLGKIWLQIVGLRSTRRRWKPASIALALAVVACALPFFISAPLMIEARGTLEPRDRRDLYAPSSGIVGAVLVEHGQAVKAGQPLVALRKPELEVESARLLGELQTTERRLSALRATRTTTASADPTARRRAQELLAEEEQLNVRLVALEQEQRLVAAQERELQVVAPVDGSVTTWDARRQLLGKPVERGHPLVSLAQVDGPWVLELRVPDRRFSEVARARAELGDRVEVEFIASADPQSRFHGRLVRLADTARTDSRYGTTIAATVALGDGTRRDDMIRDELRRPGASVIAKIHCGESTYGAIWADDVLHYLRTRWLF